MADARTAFLITTDINHEGGFQKNPNDHANWSSGKIGEGTLIGTKYGITPADMPGVDIKNITVEQAIAYYIEHYWKPLYSQIESQEVANKLADLGVLFGVGTAIRMFQTTLAVNSPIDIDGAFGPSTLHYTNETDSASLLQAFKSTFVTHALQVGAANPHEREDVPGWIRRINS